MRARLASLAALVLGLAAGGSLAGETGDLQDENQKTSYSMGYQVGSDFRRQGIEIDPELVVRGAVDALEKARPLLTREQMRRALRELQRRVDAADSAR